MIEFHIEAISCGHCVREVTRVVNEADPDARVAVDLASHTVRIEAGDESPAARERLAAALGEAGYPSA